MSDRAPPAAPVLPGSRPNLLIAATLLTVLGISAAYTFYNAWMDRSAQLNGMQDTARNLSALLDREVETSRALLSGLASSPLIAEGDFAGFHQQMLQTRRPDGVALVLSDKERQLANVLRPYGSPLPELSAFQPQPGFFERLEAEGFHVSSRVVSPLNGASSTVVTIGIPGPNHRLKYILSLALGEKRLTEILHSEAISEAAGYLVIDAMGQEIASRQPAGDLAAPVLAQEVAISADSMESRSGTFFVTDPAGEQIWTAFARSGLTGWTAAVTKPRAIVERQLRASLAPLAAATVLVAFSILGLYLYWRRRVEAPLRNMTSVLGTTREQLSQMHDDFSNLRQREHRRIAQELHDTTAQRLVAADLHLSALRHADPRDMKGFLREIKGVQDLIEQSLKELRSFAFLLRPPALSTDAFDRVLTRLFRVFAERAGLEVHIVVDPAADLLPPARKEALYRVAQEALLNTHRHARAKRITARLVQENADWVLTITDDGIGGILFPSTAENLGLGIEGIAETMAGLGGRLTILGGEDGTTLRASLPMTS